MGYTVVTTINKKAQKATVAAVKKIPKGHADNLQVAAVTLDPKTGAIRSMYGGADYLHAPAQRGDSRHRSGWLYVQAFCADRCA